MRWIPLTALLLAGCEDEPETWCFPLNEDNAYICGDKETVCDQEWECSPIDEEVKAFRMQPIVKQNSD